MERCPGQFCSNSPETPLSPQEKTALEAIAMRLSHGRAEIQRSLTAIDACRQAAETYVQTSIRKLQEAYALLNTHLTDLQAFLQISLKEAESELDCFFSHVTGKLRSPLAQRLLAGLSKPVFDFNMTTQSVPDQLCSLNVAEELWTEPQVAVIPGLWEGRLQIFQVNSHHCDSFPQEKLNSGTVFCMLDDQRVLAVGGFPATSSVFSISTATGSFTPMQSLNQPRGFPGIFKYSSLVYIFGGLADDILTSSEKYHLDKWNWSPLPALHEAKYAFSPCMLRACLYLPEFQTCCALEEFSIAYETSRLLLIDLGELRGWTVSWTHCGDLVLLTSQGQQANWHFGMSVFEVNSAEVEGCSVQTSSQVVTQGEVVLWSEISGIMVFDPRTRRTSSLYD